MGRCDGSAGGSNGPFGPSALAHIHPSARSSAFLPAGVSLHTPIIVNPNTAAHIACICTVYSDSLIAYFRWVFGTEI
jgi:hypothetical protein